MHVTYPCMCKKTAQKLRLRDLEKKKIYIYIYKNSAEVYV